MPFVIVGHVWSKVDVHPEPLTSPDFLIWGAMISSKKQSPRKSRIDSGFNEAAASALLSLSYTGELCFIAWGS